MRRLHSNPQLVGAYANLGVIEMRRKHWHQAIDLLQKAEKMAPSVAGIRLNIGLAYFRQNDFASAIASFESVVRDMPGSEQARYLLGFAISFASATQKPRQPWSLYGRKNLAS